MHMSEFTDVDAALEARGNIRMVFDLSKIERLLDLLGSPQRAYPAIHLTGTNGKTSTARMIDSLLRAFGLHTGRYTSPHLQQMTAPGVIKALVHRGGIMADVLEGGTISLGDEVAEVTAG